MKLSHQQIISAIVTPQTAAWLAARSPAQRLQARWRVSILTAHLTRKLQLASQQVWAPAAYGAGLRLYPAFATVLCNLQRQHLLPRGWALYLRCVALAYTSQDCIPSTSLLLDLPGGVKAVRICS